MQRKYTPGNGYKNFYFSVSSSVSLTPKLQKDEHSKISASQIRRLMREAREAGLMPD